MAFPKGHRLRYSGRMRHRTSRQTCEGGIDERRRARSPRSHRRGRRALVRTRRRRILDAARAPAQSDQQPAGAGRHQEDAARFRQDANHQGRIPWSRVRTRRSSSRSSPRTAARRSLDSLGQQVAKSDAYKRLEASLKTFQKAAGSTSLGVWVSRQRHAAQGGGRDADRRQRHRALRHQDRWRDAQHGADAGRGQAVRGADHRRVEIQRRALGLPARRPHLRRPGRGDREVEQGRARPEGRRPRRGSGDPAGRGRGGAQVGPDRGQPHGRGEAADQRRSTSGSASTTSSTTRSTSVSAPSTRCRRPRRATRATSTTARNMAACSR